MRRLTDAAVDQKRARPSKPGGGDAVAQGGATVGEDDPRSRPTDPAPQRHDDINAESSQPGALPLAHHLGVHRRAASTRRWTDAGPDSGPDAGPDAGADESATRSASQPRAASPPANWLPKDLSPAPLIEVISDQHPMRHCSAEFDQRAAPGKPGVEVVPPLDVVSPCRQQRSTTRCRAWWGKSMSIGSKPLISIP